MNFTSDLLTFPFKGQDRGTKWLIGSLLSLVGMIFPPAYLPVMGYGATLMRRMVGGEEPDLPDWDDWGKLFLDGLRLAGIWLFYMLPVIVLYIVVYSVFFAAMFSPMAFMNDPEEFYPVMTSAMMGSWAIMMCGFGIGFLLSIPLSYLALVAGTRSIINESFMDGLQIGEVFALAREEAGKYMMAFLVVAVAYMGLFAVVWFMQITFVLSCFTIFVYPVGAYYISVIIGAAFGKAYRSTQENPPELAPSV